MHVHVHLFAQLREKAGRSAISLELPEGATVGDAIALMARETALAPALLRTARAAVNREYCQLDHALADGDEVALIPPVSGG